MNKNQNSTASSTNATQSQNLNTPPVIPGPTTPPEQPPITKQNNTKMYLLIGIVILLILFPGAIFLVMQTDKNTNPTPYPSTSPQPLIYPLTTPMPSLPSAHSNQWKTYSNTEFGYSFSYPADWYYSPPGEDKPHGTSYLFKTPEETYAFYDFGLEITTSILSGISFDDYLEDQAATFNASESHLNTAIVEGSEVLIGNLPTKKIYLESFVPDDKKYTIYYAFSDGMLVSITHHHSDKEVETVKSILSSFTIFEYFQEVRTEAYKYISPTEQINSVGYLGTHKDKYIVGINDPSVASGGSILLIGKSATGEWVVPPGGSLLYCEWINTANLGEADKAFYGQSCF